MIVIHLIIWDFCNNYSAFKVCFSSVLISMSSCSSMAGPSSNRENRFFLIIQSCLWMSLDPYSIAMIVLNFLVVSMMSLYFLQISNIARLIQAQTRVSLNKPEEYVYEHCFYIRYMKWPWGISRCYISVKAEDKLVFLLTFTNFYYICLFWITL